MPGGDGIGGGEEGIMWHFVGGLQTSESCHPSSHFSKSVCYLWTSENHGREKVIPHSSDFKLEKDGHTARV